MGAFLAAFLGGTGAFFAAMGAFFFFFSSSSSATCRVGAGAARLARFVGGFVSAAAAPRFTPACFEPPSPPSPFFCTPGTNAVVRPPTVMNEMAFPPIFPATFPHRRWKSQSLGKRSASAPARHAVSTTCPIARRTSRSCAAESVRAEASGCILAW